MPAVDAFELAKRAIVNIGEYGSWLYCSATICEYVLISSLHIITFYFLSRERCDKNTILFILSQPTNNMSSIFCLSRYPIRPGTCRRGDNLWRAAD